MKPNNRGPAITNRSLTRCIFRALAGGVALTLGSYGVGTLLLTILGIKIGVDFQEDKCIGFLFLYEETPYEEGMAEAITDANAKVNAEVDAEIIIDTKLETNTKTNTNTPNKTPIMAKKEALYPCINPGLYVFRLNEDWGPFKPGTILVKELVATGRCLMVEKIVPPNTPMSKNAKLYTYELIIRGTQAVFLEGDAVILKEYMERWYCNDKFVGKGYFQLKTRIEFGKCKMIPTRELENSREPKKIREPKKNRELAEKLELETGPKPESEQENVPERFQLSYFNLPQSVLLERNRLYKISLNTGEMFLVGATSHALDSRVLGAVPINGATRYHVLWYLGKPLMVPRRK